MIPNIYIHEHLAHEHRQTLLCEAEQERLLAEGQHAPPPSWHHLAGRLGRYLIVVGTRLQRASAASSGG